jgi:hypothetical protein
VDECLFDGNELQVEWTAKSEAGELAFFSASGLDSPSVALAQQGEPEILQLNDFVPLGDAMDGVAVSREYHGYTAVTLPDGAGGKAFDVTIHGVFMKPVAPAVLLSDLKENISGRPTRLANAGEDQTFLEPISTLTLDGEGGWSGDSREFDPYMEKLRDHPSEAERTAAYVKGLTEFGYAKLLSQIDLTFTVSPDAAHIYATEIDGLSAFEFDDRTVTIKKADFSAAHTSLEGVMIAKGGAAEEDLFKLNYELCPNGVKAAVNINCEQGSANPVNGHDCVEFNLWGDPLPELPDTVTLQAYRYPEGLFDESGDQNTPVRVPEYDITLKLKKVS